MWPAILSFVVIYSSYHVYFVLYTIYESNSLCTCMCTGDAITTELIRYGLRVGVVVFPASHMLKTEQALKFVGPAAFGFDIPYQEPKNFP